jgi:2-polyprenyl-3-methyl-5-hydroxy-6-metoxy-1,4-benzoquinol methylase
MNSGVEQNGTLDGRTFSLADAREQGDLTREQATELVRQRYPAHAPPTRCAACGSRRSEPLTWRRGFRIAECHDCGFLWVDPMISAQDLWVFYNRRTWRPYTSQVVRHKFQPELRVVKAQVPTPARVLDVGCGHGHFASLLQRAGYQVVGVDIDGQALAYAAEHYGLTTSQGDLPRLALDGRFAAITLLSSLEHMANPFEVLGAAASLLETDGVLIVSTPRGDGLIPRLSRRFFLPALRVWEFLSPPSHLNYFTRRSLTAMLNRAGFASVAFVSRDRDARYKRRELQETLAESEQRAGLARALYPCLRALRLPARLVHAGDMMICVARRRHAPERTGRHE